MRAMMGEPLLVSLVVNTCDRRPYLQETLASLAHQTYRHFEVVVVNGPSEDDTDRLLDSYAHAIKRGSCPERRLGLSRNVGIGLAAGDVVAFLDDDAVPEDEWLAKLAAAYDSADVAAVGGYVFDVPLGCIEYRLCTCARSGDATTKAAGPATQYLGRGADPFLYLPGCNMSFRRSILLEVGGFDEDAIYFYDDAEVCGRIVDAGYRLTVLEDAIVKHHRAPNAVRDVSQQIRDFYSVIHSRAVFALRQAGEDHSRREQALAGLETLARSWRGHANAMREQGVLNADECARFCARIDAGLTDGVEAGSKLRLFQRFAQLPAPFLPFPLPALA